MTIVFDFLNHHKHEYYYKCTCCDWSDWYAYYSEPDKKCPKCGKE